MSLPSRTLTVSVRQTHLEPGGVAVKIVSTYFLVDTIYEHRKSKNWLFSNTRSGAEASVILYSFVETAKANDLQPVVYLQALFEQLPHTSATDIGTLSPWNIQLN